MNGTLCFDLAIWSRKLLKYLLLVAKVLTLKQNFYSNLYLQTGPQEKTAHYNSQVEKKSEKRTDK